MQRGNNQIYINDNGFVHAFSVVMLAELGAVLLQNKQTEAIHLYRERNCSVFSAHLRPQPAPAQTDTVLFLMTKRRAS